ncbi:biosynthetic-type acetolactate synthase large subunit [Clostridium ljungdahlii]|uniref:Acetolactate synthase n=1 Tax=Clostridium ljungdahlii TaxID=1538 RepID=A0A168LYN8_9CLOT|nr:biosynthetic-type acetolactate synthase large subunit [Clostridium ljungdahlii]OAA83877.1 Acetolactate synthase isozyme 2 large subunit [Clostridium ljungdahlii]
MKIKGAEVLLKCMMEQGVDTVFGYPGGAVLPIYDALYAAKGKITHISTSHEQGAAHAADGYARSTGKVGVVIATSGPGATNTVTAIATAYMDSVPIVVFTGQVARSLLGKDSFQEVNIKDITTSITKKSCIVEKVEDLADTVREAFQIAASGRPGPVVVDIPKDIQSAEVEYEPSRSKLSEIKEKKYFNLDEYGNNLNKAIDMINRSERPVIYSGGGTVTSGAQNELMELVEKIDSPITCSLMGIGAFPGDNEYYMGMVGMHGSRCSNYAVSNCDLLIAIGARFSDRVISKVSAFAPKARIIHIDIDPKEFGKNVDIDVAIKGDVKEVLQKLNCKLKKADHRDWMEKIKQWKSEQCEPFKECKLSPKFIMDTLYNLTGGDCIVTTEVGQNQIWTAQYFKFLMPRTFVSSGGLGTMGFGLGASIGASMGNPGKKVINVAGDGSFKMNSIELATVAKYKLPIVQLLLNNRALGMVYQWQDMFYGKRFSNTELGPDVDFMKLGEAYGIKTFKIEDNSQVEKCLKEALDLDEPVIIECDIDRKEKVFPIVPPGAAISDLVEE